MSLKTSTGFACALASGTDWRDTAKSVLEDLQSVRTDNDNFTLGFLYISDDLAEDANSILNLFRSVTGIEDWVGCITVGVCANGECLLGDTAIAAMIGQFNDDSFVVVPGTNIGMEHTENLLTPWMKNNDPFCTIIHGDPISEGDPVQDLNILAETTQSFLVGGLSSSRGLSGQFANDVYENGFSGVVFNRDQAVVTAITQGCKPVGKTHTISRAHENTIMQLDKKPAFQVFTEDIRDYAKSKAEKMAAPSDQIPSDQIPSGQNPSGQNPSGQNIYDSQKEPSDIGSTAAVIAQLQDVISPVKQMFEGEIHLAFPIKGLDLKDYLVRNIIGLDPDHGWISTSQLVNEGDQVMLVRRDHDSMEEDLSKMLLNLRKRFHQDYGEADPKAGLYISCIARAQGQTPKSTSSGESQQSKSQQTENLVPTREMELIKEIIGDIPMIGYYASGEISNARLYGYTGILILFN